MKNTKPTPTLEEMLATVEHAGRDARCQQQLSEMIEGLAAKETAARRRVVSLWTARIAAAACLAGVILTFVHYMNMTVEPDGPMVAKVQPTGISPRPVIHATETLQPAVPSRQEGQVIRHVRPTVAMPERLPDAVEEEDFTVLTEALALAPVDLSDLYAEAEPEYLPSEALAQVESTQEPKTAERPKRRSIFSIGNAEPDLMEGNTLSIRLI
ncbi:MAG: hypothetical protein J6X88_09870 [Bacteroidales bacterium]|nr:hypothetical protein [Bacteroidales bacterium]